MMSDRIEAGRSSVGVAAENILQLLHPHPAEASPEAYAGAHRIAEAIHIILKKP